MSDYITIPYLLESTKYLVVFFKNNALRWFISEGKRKFEKHNF